MNTRNMKVVALPVRFTISRNRYAMQHEADCIIVEVDTALFLVRKQGRKLLVDLAQPVTLVKPATCEGLHYVLSWQFAWEGQWRDARSLRAVPLSKHAPFTLDVERGINKLVVAVAKTGGIDVPLIVEPERGQRVHMQRGRQEGKHSGDQ